MNTELVDQVKHIFFLDGVIHILHSDIDNRIIIKFDSFYMNRLGSESLNEMEKLGYRIGFFDFDVNTVVFQQIDYDNPVLN